jgi:hypothetical protein
MTSEARPVLEMSARLFRRDAFSQLEDRSFVHRLTKIKWEEIKMAKNIV